MISRRDWAFKLLRLRPSLVPAHSRSFTNTHGKHQEPGHWEAPPGSRGRTPDVSFEIIGSTFSLLSVSLSASQSLNTRRGCLAAISGRPEDVTSTLSLLNPLRRALFRIPFLYQKITSTTPITALVSTRSSNTAMTSLHLDGTQDWVLARDSLLSWSGQRLVFDPYFSVKMPLAYTANTLVTGRGLIALVGKGSIMQVNIGSGETYTVHPSNILAYTLNASSPKPRRLNSGSLRLQIPDFGSYLVRFQWYRTMRASSFWRNGVKTWQMFRKWFETLLWGERMFLEFEGPATLLVQSRAWRLNEILAEKELREIETVSPLAANALLHTGSAQRVESQDGLSTGDIGAQPTLPR